jgi:thiol-disulfide isomerase/thioredoxin
MILGGLIILWRPLSQRIGERAIFSADSVDESYFHELVMSSRDKITLLDRVWNTGKIPHRQAVVRVLKEDPAPELKNNSTRRILLMAAQDGDESLRQIALGALAQGRDPLFQSVAALQLHDADPEVRDFARPYLAKESTNLNPSLAAELPRIDPPLVNDFELQNVEGRRFHLADFRGKTVLLNFWATWCTSCVSEFPILNAFQQKHSNDLVIIGIALDTDSDEPGVLARKTVERTIVLRGLKYLILLDPEKVTSARFNGGELPTNILIDSRGRFRRRFVGPRPLEVLEQMIAEVQSSQ